MNSGLLEGSFREAAHNLDIPVLLYESGEALRFDEVAIRAGVRGVLNVMIALGMRSKPRRHRQPETMITNSSQWVRAPQSGILRALVATGANVQIGDTLAYINDPLGENAAEVTSPVSGIIVGKTNLPLVFAGGAIFNIACYEAADEVSDHIEAYHEELSPSGDEREGDEPPLV